MHAFRRVVTNSELYCRPLFLTENKEKLEIYVVTELSKSLMFLSSKWLRQRLLKDILRVLVHVCMFQDE